MSYKQRITKHLSLIDTLAAKRFVNPVLADEAVVYVLEKLQEDQGSRLAGFTGVSLFASYLSSVVMRLFEDFSRKRFGRLRPPAWLSRLGGMWLVVFKLLCMERKSYPEVVDVMQAHYDLSAKTSEHMGTTILAEVVDCGHRKGQTVAMDDVETYADGGGRGTVKGLEEQERVVLFKALFQHLMADEDAPVDTSCFDLDFKLSGQEKILLKLCYQDGIAVSQAGQMVGLSTHQVHGKMRRLLKRLKKILTVSGMAASLTPFLVDE
jgi:RNA polymerase sigma factor (sigma-70 family)